MSRSGTPASFDFVPGSGRATPVIEPSFTNDERTRIDFLINTVLNASEESYRSAYSNAHQLGVRLRSAVIKLLTEHINSSTALSVISNNTERLSRQLADYFISLPPCKNDNYSRMCQAIPQLHRFCFGVFSYGYFRIAALNTSYPPCPEYESNESAIINKINSIIIENLTARSVSQVHGQASRHLEVGISQASAGQHQDHKDQPDNLTGFRGFIAPLAEGGSYVRPEFWSEPEKTRRGSTRRLP